MSKPVPLELGQVYHIYNRGNNREVIFRETRNYPFFLERYTKYVDPIADTYAYCLLGNHFHFLVRIKTEEEQKAWFDAVNRQLLPPMAGATQPFKPKNPSQQFGNLFNAYTKAFNKTYSRTGSLFQKPFRRIEVTTQVHFTNVVVYIHQNPLKHGLARDWRTWPYSSYAALRSTQPTSLHRSDVMERFGGLEAFLIEHQRVVEFDTSFLEPP